MSNPRTCQQQQADRDREIAEIERQEAQNAENYRRVREYWGAGEYAEPLANEG